MKPSLVIVGLGNPGSSYEKSRHNAGFRAVDHLGSIFGEGDAEPKQKFLSVVQEGKIGDVRVLFVKPQTFMNRSGEAVRKLVDFLKLDPSFQVFVLSDDCDLPLGEVRFRAKGGPGTHNGLKSVVEHIGEDFPRLRIGLGSPPPGVDLASWVLSVPQPEELARLESVAPQVLEQVKSFVQGK